MVLESYIEYMAKNPLASMSLNILKRLDKEDLMEIILLRESTLHNAQNMFEQSLKTKDREVFITMRREIEMLNEALVSKYPSLRIYHEEIKELKEKLNVMRLKIIKKHGGNMKRSKRDL